MINVRTELVDRLTEMDSTLRSLENEQKVWIYSLRLFGDRQAFRVIGLDGCVFTCFNDEYGNPDNLFFSLVVSDSPDKAMTIGKKKFLAASSAFTYVNGVSYSALPTDSAFSIDSLESIDDFLDAEDLLQNRMEAFSFLFRKLKSSNVDDHYHRIMCVYDAVYGDDPYALQAAEYLVRAFSTGNHSPSESISVFFKLFEVLSCKIDGIFEKRPNFSDERIDTIIAQTGLNEDIADSLRQFRDFRNNLAGHGVVEPEIQSLLNSYVPTEAWEHELISDYGNIKDGLIEYRLTAETLGRKIFSEIIGVPFFILQYAGCHFQLSDKRLITTNALEPMQSPQPSYEGVDCGAGF